MSNSATCPRCCRVVSLPVGASAEQTFSAAVDVWVRCPLCRSEFRLEEALNFVPPPLEIIPQPHPQPQLQPAIISHADSLGQLPPPVIPRLSAEQAIPDLLINPEDEDFAVAEQNFAPPHPAFVPPAFSQVMVGQSDTEDDLQLSPETPAVRAVPMPTRTTGVRPIGAGTGIGAAAEEPWNAPPVGENQPTFFPPLPPKRGRRFRRTRRRNPVVELILIIVGGVMGSAMGYGILLWGFKVDPFELAKYLPPSMLPEQFKPAEPASDNNSDVMQGKGILITRNRPVGPADRTTFAEPPVEASANSPLSAGAAASNPTVSTPPAPPAVSAQTAAQSQPELPPLVDSTVPPPEAAAETDGPKTDRVYSLADVSQAITAATQADAAFQAVLADEKTSAESADLKELRKQNYIALTKLAEIVTLLRSQNDDRQIARSSAAAFVLHMADDPSKLQDLGLLAGQWMDAPGRGNRGIVLAGTVQRIEPVGKQFRTVVKLFGHDTEVPVISAEQPEVSSNDTVLVLGALVPDPRQTLPQYAGKDEPVVWSAVIEKATPTANPPA